MSTSTIVIGVYSAAGSCVAFVVYVAKRDVAGMRGLRAAVAMLFLWPFLLPFALVGDEALTLPNQRAARIEAKAERLGEAWMRAGKGGTRESTVTTVFLDRLRKQAERLLELETASKQAGPAIKPKLDRMIEVTSKELEQGLELLDEMAGQLTLLRFAPLGNEDEAKNDREHILELIARIESMTNGADPS